MEVFFNLTNENIWLENLGMFSYDTKKKKKKKPTEKQWFCGSCIFQMSDIFIYKNLILFPCDFLLHLKYNMYIMKHFLPVSTCFVEVMDF